MCIQNGAQAIEMGQGLSPEEIHQARRTIHQRLHGGIFRVQDAQRIAVQPSARVLVQLVGMRLEICDQRLSVLLAFCRLSQAVDLQLPGEPQPVPEVAGHQDQLGINVRTCEAQGFSPELMKLR